MSRESASKKVGAPFDGKAGESPDPKPVESDPDLLKLAA